MFYKNEQFPFIKYLEAAWPDIKGELLALPDTQFHAWPEKRFYNAHKNNDGWNLFGFYAWGVRLDKNCEICPKTAEALSHVPGIMNAGFSQMKPGTIINPHTGYPEGLLRCHLGVIVPGQCALKVGGEVMEWEEGKCFVFDDTVLHEAWNKSDQRRVVLLLDFKAEDLVVNKPKRRKGFLGFLLGNKKEKVTQ